MAAAERPSVQLTKKWGGEPLDCFTLIERTTALIMVSTVYRDDDVATQEQ